MKEISVPARASEPPRDGGLTVAEDPWSLGSIQPFGQCREYHGDFVSGGFQTIQRRVASSTERRAAGGASKRLDALSQAMLAITNERMHVSIGDPAVSVLRVGTSETFGVYAFGGSSATFHFRPGAYRSRR